MVLGIDLGTSCVKVALFDPESGRRAAATWPETGELARTAPQPGWAEQNPTDWWIAVVSAIRLLPCDLVKQVSAVGISYQMHGLVLLSDSGMPVRPAIIWCDDRAVGSGNLIANELDDATRAGLLNEPGNFTLAKLRWVRDHESKVFAQARWAMLPGDYLAFRLTGDFSTTATGLSEMVAWDFTESAPSDEAWGVAAGDLRLRPTIVPMQGDQGSVSASANVETGLPVGTPITYRCGDQPNNAFALGVVAPGTLAAVAGTSGVLYGVSDTAIRDDQNRVNTFLHVTDSVSARRNGVLMCINGAGSSYSWLNRVLGKSYEELNQMAEQAPHGAAGLQVFPFGNGSERIFGNRSPGGSVASLNFNVHGANHLARATLEGVAYTMRYGLDLMKQMGIRTDVIRAGDASMFRSTLFSQIFCDVTGCPLELMDTDGALGAARGAALGLGGKAPPEPAVIRSFVPDSAPYKEHYDAWRSRLTQLISIQA